MADVRSRHEEPPGDASDTTVPGAAFARVEHSLGSLLDLARGLSLSLDLHQTADLLLFNLMGHLATGRAAVWLMSRDGVDAAVLLRSHGFDRALVRQEGETVREALLAQFGQAPTHALLGDLGVLLGPDATALVRDAGMDLFAPLLAQSELFGWIALGRKVTDEAYSTADFQFIEAALGVAGIALQNARLHTEVLEANRQLQGSNAHLREINRLKSEFLSNVNHELRTPLTVVMGTLECLVETDGSGERTQSLLAAALERAHHLNGLLENLLTFSDSVRTRLAVEVADVDVAELLDRYHQKRGPGVTAGLRELAFHGESDLPKVRCDSQRLLQILDQLLDNAVKFTPIGSHVWLRVDRTVESDRSWVRVEVEDDGPGIPAERIETIFNSFEQVDGSHTRTVGGLGMGLALARQLADRMECRLAVRSTPGAGSTFTLLLPEAS